MAPKKGYSKPEYTAEQRADIVERVCALYESQSSTIESCCDACDVSIRAFNLWCAQNAEFAERYKKAKSTANENWFENVLVPKAKRASELLLEERDVEEEKEEELAFQGVKTGDKRKIVTRSKQQPNATLAIFAMKGAMPDKFKDTVQHTGPNGGPIQFEGLSTEEKRQLLALLAKAKDGQ